MVSNKFSRGLKFCQSATGESTVDSSNIQRSYRDLKPSFFQDGIPRLGGT